MNMCSVNNEWITDLCQVEGQNKNTEWLHTFLEKKELNNWYIVCSFQTNRGGEKRMQRLYESSGRQEERKEAKEKW